MASGLSISEVNKLDNNQFEWVFENVIELCTDAASKVKLRRPFNSVQDLCEAFHKYLDELSSDAKVTVLRLHPDLAGSLAQRGSLTSNSADEQRSAGLLKLTMDQRNNIQALNERYKSKFGFPFIICVRENKIPSIMEGLQIRYNNTRDIEIRTGIEEVKKICSLRILDIVES